MRMKIIMAVILTIILLGIAYIVAQANDIPYPDPDPRCVTPWNLLWTFPSDRCGGGQYYMFVCEQELYAQKPLYHPVCISSINKLNILVFPLIWKN